VARDLRPRRRSATVGLKDKRVLQVIAGHNTSGRSQLRSALPVVLQEAHGFPVLLSRACRILIVEDNDAVRDLVEAVCVDEGFIVVSARNSFEGREQITLDGFDAVIIDITIPGGEDAFALGDRAARRRVGVILTTGNPVHFERLESSGHAFLKKPFRVSKLLSVLDAVMTRRNVQCRHWHRRPHEQEVPL
jgi:DNA-binding NtrC family response regulator